MLMVPIDHDPNAKENHSRGGKRRCQSSIQHGGENQE
jgi:hypothetical protein